MLDDKQSAKSIAALISTSGSVTEADILALAKPKPAASAYMSYVADQREAASKELGSRTMAELSKVLGERWTEQADTSRWEELAEQDRERYKGSNLSLTGL